MNTHCWGSFAAAVIVTGTFSAAQAAPIVNGSFEEPVIMAGSTYQEYAVGSTITPGWTVVGAAAEQGATPQLPVAVVSSSYVDGARTISVPADEGSQWLDLTGNTVNRTDAGVQQTVSTVPGMRYTLRFKVGNIGAGGIFGSESKVVLLINGQKQDDDFTNKQVAGSHTLLWMEFNKSFIATGPTTTFTFLNGDGPADNSNGLDRVELIEG